MWDLIVSVPDHCLSFYFLTYSFYLSFNDDQVSTAHAQKMLFQYRYCIEADEKITRKKMLFQYRYCIEADEKITVSYLGSSCRESTNGITTNYVLLDISRTTYNTYTKGS